MVNKQEACRLFNITNRQWAEFRDTLQDVIDRNSLGQDRWQIGTAARDRATKILLQQRAEIFPEPFLANLRVESWSEEQTDALMRLACPAKGNLSQQRRRRGTAAVQLSESAHASSDPAVADTKPAPLCLKDCQFVVERDGPIDGSDEVITLLARDMMTEDSTTITIDTFLQSLQSQGFADKRDRIAIRANGEWDIVYSAREEIWQSALRINLRLRQQVIKCKVWL
jgi:hypothetical protein